MSLRMLTSQALLAILSRLPDELSVWQASAQLIGQAQRHTELSRAARALAIQPMDFADWAAEQDGVSAERVSRHSIVSGLRRLPASGFTTADLLPMIVFGTGVFSGMSDTVAKTWGISRQSLSQVMHSVRDVTKACVYSAAVNGPTSPPAFLSARRPLEGTGVEIATSIGFAVILDRAEALRGDAGADSITSACLLRAALPYWATPTTLAFLRGLGVGIEIATPSWIRDCRELPFAEVKLDRSPERYLMSEQAWKSVVIAGLLRDQTQTPMTLEQVFLGLLSVGDSCLSQLATTAVGEHVNLPLLYLTAGSQLRVSADEAKSAVDLGERTPGLVSALDDLPGRLITAITRGIHPDAPLAQSWDSRSRAASAITMWRAERGDMTSGPTSATGQKDYETFLLTGNIQSLRDYVIDLPEDGYRADMAAARLLRGDLDKPSAADLHELGVIPGQSGAVIAPLCGSDPEALTAEDRLGAKIVILASQNWCAEDLNIASRFGFSITDLAFEGAKEGNPYLTAACTALEARASARGFRAGLGLPSGIPGSGLGMVGLDIHQASGTLVTVLLDADRSCVARLDSEAVAVTRTFRSASLSAWWKSYRRACLSAQPTTALLRDLSELTGIAAVLPAAPADDVLRLCVAGRYQGLPIGQALVSSLTRRDVSVITHLAGGPFRDRLATALAPAGLLRGRTAVLSPPPLHGVPELPFAMAEAEAIQRIHDARFKISGIFARKSSILRIMDVASDQHRPLVWHFAAHGTMQPTPSGDVVAGVLVVDHEMVSAVDIGKYARANVILCSACDIAAIPPDPNSPSWPFAALIGGASFVVAAPRPVSDPITLATMLRVHEIWVSDRLPIWKALTMGQHWVETAPLEEIAQLLSRNEISDDLINLAVSAILHDREKAGLGDQWSFGTYAL